MEDRVDIMGVLVDRVTMDGAVGRVESFLQEGGAHVVVTPNSEIIESAAKDAELQEALRRADLSIPDGVGVVYASKILGTPLPEKVPGCDLCTRVLELLNRRGGRLFLLGGKPGVAQAAAERIGQDYPQVVVCGVCDGYFKEDEPVLDLLRRSEPDVVFVCLGAPKQEKWIDKNRAQLPDAVMIGAGGTVDVLAGNVQRAPAFYIDHGLEWFYRLMREPRRIGRMMKLPVFGMKVLWKRGMGHAKR